MFKIKLKKRWIFIIILAIVFSGAGTYYVFGKKDKVEYVTARTERGALIQTVSETGTVKAASELNLNFLNSGKVKKVLVKVGDKVAKDQPLAELDYDQLSLKQREAQANLSAAQASLAKLRVGASQIELLVAEASVSQAKTSYDSAQKESANTQKVADENVKQAKKTLNDLELKTDSDVTTYEQAVVTAEISLENAKKTYKQALDNKIDTGFISAEEKINSANVALDNIYKILNDGDAKNLLSVKNSFYLGETDRYYNEAKVLADLAQANIDAVRSNKNFDSVNSVLTGTLSALNKTLSALSNCYRVLENSVTSTNFTQAELDAYKTTISSQQTTISTAISTISSSKQNLADASLSYDTNISTAQNSLTQAKVNLDNATISARNAYSNALINSEQQIALAQSRVDSALKAWELSKVQLDKTKSPARSEDIRAAEAQVAQVQAALQLAALQIDNSIMKAPLDGIVTAINYEEGEDTSLSKPVIAMLGENNLEIEALISETDVAKVGRDNEAEITLDAFGDDRKFKAFIVSVDPAETVIQEVIYYKINVAFADAKEKLADIKSGMTANVLITTNKKDDVLIIPSRAIIEKTDGIKIVRTLVDNKVNEIPVGLGVRGDNGKIEIVSGLKEGDVVVTSIKEKK